MMTRTAEKEASAGTHVGEWADFVGADVPEDALRERTLGDPLVPPREDPDEDLPGGAC